MYEPADRLAGCRSTNSSNDSKPLAPVIAFPPRPRRQRASIPHPNRLSAWLFSLVNAAQRDGTEPAVLQPSMTWEDVIATASAGPRLALVAANPDMYAAIAHALANLTSLGARPRVDVVVTLTPDRVSVDLCGILAEPVMTPAVADNLTATLQSSGSSEWSLRATEHGTLHWHLADGN
jgi:hypothetical protein